MERRTSIAEVKNGSRLREWTAQIEAQHSSGETVSAWCAENGINPKTYYYRQKKVREQRIDATPQVVPLPATEQHAAPIVIEKDGLRIILPAETSPDTLAALVRELC